MMTADKMQIFN